ncbi:MAG: hypothetical protein AABZ30_04145, partial [Myxococcota bacterium]
MTRRIALFLTVLATTSVALAQTVPHAITYTGRLTEGGEPYADDQADLIFRLFAAEVAFDGEEPVWQEAHLDTDVEEGLFTAILGEDTPLDGTVLTGAELYLEITVGTEALTRLPLRSVGYAVRAEDAETLGGLTSSDFAAAWGTASCLSNQAIQVISDDGTVTCENVPTAGAGLSASATALSVDFATFGNCADDEKVVGWNAVTGALECAPDQGVTLTASRGVVLSGTDIQLDGTGCSLYDVLKYDDATGGWACAPDDNTGVAYTADEQTLTLAGSQFALKTLAMSCAADSAIMAINADGTVVCQATGTTYTGASPVAVTGTVVGLESASCPNDGAWKWNTTTSTWNCAMAGDITAVTTTGGGLLGGGTSGAVALSVDYSVYGSCGDPSHKVTGVNTDGTVACSPETGDISGVTVGSGLTGGGTVGSPTVSINWSHFADNLLCPAGQSIRGFSADGLSTVCEVDDTASVAGGVGDIDAVQTPVAGGLTGGADSGSVSLSINFGTAQRRVAGVCDPGYGMQTIASDGTVSCEAFGDILGITTSATSGLTGGSTTGTPSLAVSFTGSNGTLNAASRADHFHYATLACTGTQKVSSFDAAGAPVCTADTDTNSGGTVTSLTAATPWLTGGTITGSGTIGLATANLTCAVGNAIRSVNADGTVTCEADDNAGGTVTSLTAGTWLTGGTITGSGTIGLNTTALVCAAGSSIRSINAAGTVTCEDDTDTNSGGTVTSVVAGTPWLTGGTITGTGTIGLNLTNLSCAVGSSIRVVNADGTVTCQVDATSAGGGAGDMDAVLTPAGSGLLGGASAGTVSLSADFTASGVGGNGVATTVARGDHFHNAGAACAAGSYVSSFNATGVPVCTADGGGDITDVVAGMGLTGGAATGAATVNVVGGNGITANADNLDLGPLTANWSQTGAFDLVLANAGSELSMLESVGGTFSGTLDVGDLAASQTYTFSGADGTVWTSGNDGAASTLDADLLDGLSSAAFAVAAHTHAILTRGTGLTGANYDGSAATTWDVAYGATAGTATQGNQTATVTAGGGLAGGVAADALGDGVSAALAVGAGTGIQVNADDIAVLYGAIAGTATQGNQTATVTAGGGLA